MGRLADISDRMVREDLGLALDDVRRELNPALAQVMEENGGPVEQPWLVVSGAPCAGVASAPPEEQVEACALGEAS